MMTRRNLSYSSLSFFIVVILSFIVTSVRGDKCFLCAKPQQQVVDGRLSYKFSDGTSCKDAYLGAFRLTRFTNKCRKHKKKYQRKCCNPKASIGGSPGSTTPKLPPYEGQIGDAPDCPICRTKEYPGKPNQFIIARYVGEFTCAQLFQRGYHGMIPKTMCGPLQDFAYSVCGCGIYNPACRDDRDKCWGGSKYKPPYIINYSTLGSSSSTTSSRGGDGNRNLRDVDPPIVISTTPMHPDDLHFESKDEEEDMEMMDEEIEDEDE